VKTALYRRFTDGIPEYLARHYWWAYLWRAGVWFFDHQPVINAILFGQYRKLMRQSLRQIAAGPVGRTLQLTCVYGAFTPRLLEQMKGSRLHLADVAPIQLEAARNKARDPTQLLQVRLNAEYLAYGSDSFDRVIVFFLFHELPPGARARTLAECIRVLRPGGRLLVTEYAPLPMHHLWYRFAPARWLLTRLEPFLDGFWHEDIDALLREESIRHSKNMRIAGHKEFFAHFYRVTEYEMVQSPRRLQTAATGS